MSPQTRRATRASSAAPEPKASGEMTRRFIRASSTAPATKPSMSDRMAEKVRLAKWRRVYTTSPPEDFESYVPSNTKPPPQTTRVTRQSSKASSIARDVSQTPNAFPRHRRETREIISISPTPSPPSTPSPDYDFNRPPSPPDRQPLPRPVTGSCSVRSPRAPFNACSLDEDEELAAQMRGVVQDIFGAELKQLRLLREKAQRVGRELDADIEPRRKAFHKDKLFVKYVGQAQAELKEELEYIATTADENRRKRKYLAEIKEVAPRVKKQRESIESSLREKRKNLEKEKEDRLAEKNEKDSLYKGSKEKDMREVAEPAEPKKVQAQALVRPRIAVVPHRGELRPRKTWAHVTSTMSSASANLILPSLRR